jgi:hypothetical protein
MVSKGKDGTGNDDKKAKVSRPDLETLVMVKFIKRLSFMSDFSLIQDVCGTFVTRVQLSLKDHCVFLQAFQKCCMHQF